MIRSLRKLHVVALTGVLSCLAVAMVAGFLLFQNFADRPGQPPSGVTFICLGLVAAALVGVVFINLALYRTVGAVRRDIRSLVHMFKDVRQGAVRLEYPVEFTEFAAAQRYLRGWGEQMLAERERLKDMGLIDHLSQLSNRRHFELRLKELFDNLGTHGPSTVLIIDVDYFKSVNDSHGHDAGDALIMKFAALLRDNVRQADILARLGGDEFCIVYTYVALDKAVDLADRLRRSLPREIDLKPGLRHALRWSGGLSMFRDDDIRPDDVLRRADRALFAAKDAGRNRTVIDRAGDDSDPVPDKSI